MNSAGQGPSRLEPGSLASFLDFVWRYRILTVGLTAAAGVAAVIYVLVVPVQYTARATLLPESTSGSGLLSIMGSMGGSALSTISSLAGLAPEAAMSEAILNSERLADLVDEEFQLAQRYKAKNRLAYLRTWYSRLETGTDDQGLLTIRYREKDPELASKIVLRLIEHLDTFNRTARTNAGRRTRVFIEGRIEDARARLAEVEGELVSFQEKNKGLALSPTTQAAITAGAALLSKRIVLETEVQVLRQNLSDQAPAVLAKRAEINALDRELERLPKLTSKLAELQREMQVQEQAFAFLAAQLEEARIAEARDTPTIDVLDPPVVPDEKSHPQRTITVLATFFIVGLLSLGAAKILDSVRQVRGVMEAEGG